MANFLEEWEREYNKILDVLPPELHAAVLKEQITELSAHLEGEFGTGDCSASLKCVHLCIAMDLPIPEWAKNYFVDSCFAGYTGKLKSWDQAFGPPYTPAKHRRQVRDSYFGAKIYERVEAEHAAGRPIDDKLFDKIGRDLGIGGKTLVKELYSDTKRGVAEVEAAIEAHETRIRLTPPKDGE